MADNYLENKFDEYRHGKSIIRKVNPSLDFLLSYVAEDIESEDCGYEVKQAQLDSAVRSASRLGTGVEFLTDESNAEITLRSDSELELGEALLAVRLKAAELKLRCSILPGGSDSEIKARLYRQKTI